MAASTSLSSTPSSLPSMIDQNISDHEIIIDGEVLSFNMLNPGAPNGIDITTERRGDYNDTTYNARLNKMLQPLTDAIVNNKSIRIVLFQEAPPTGHRFWSELQKKLHDQGLTFNFEAGADGKCILFSNEYTKSETQESAANLDVDKWTLYRTRYQTEKQDRAELRALMQSDEGNQSVQLLTLETNGHKKTIVNAHYRSQGGEPKCAAINATLNLLKGQKIVGGDTNADIDQLFACEEMKGDNSVSSGHSDTSLAKSISLTSAPNDKKTKVKKQNKIDLIVYPIEHPRITTHRGTPTHSLSTSSGSEKKEEKKEEKKKKEEEEKKGEDKKREEKKREEKEKKREEKEIEEEKKKEEKKKEEKEKKEKEEKEKEKEKKEKGTAAAPSRAAPPPDTRPSSPARSMHIHRDPSSTARTPAETASSSHESKTTSSIQAGEKINPDVEAPPGNHEKKPAFTDPDQIAEIKRQLGNEWEVKEPSSGSAFRKVSDRQGHHFEIYTFKLTTTDNEVETFKAMLKSFKAVHGDNYFPKITPSPGSRNNWIAACVAVGYKQQDMLRIIPPEHKPDSSFLPPTPS